MDLRKTLMKYLRRLPPFDRRKIRNPAERDRHWEIVKARLKEERPKPKLAVPAAPPATPKPRRRGRKRKRTETGPQAEPPAPGDEWRPG
jgi:hypothetical protein